MIDLTTSAYNHLPLIAEVRPEPARVPAIFDEARRVIEVHSCADVVSVAIAHRHFTLEDGAVLVWSDEAGSIRARPMVRDPALIVPVVWVPTGASVVAVEYATIELCSQSLRSRIESEDLSRMLAEFACAPWQHSNIGISASVTPRLFAEYYFRGDIAVGRDRVFRESQADDGASSVVVPGRGAGRDESDLMSSTWGICDGSIKVVGACTPCKARPE